MELIASFQIDHSRLLPGIYESRVDRVGSELVTTFDIRMTAPNREPAVHPGAMHTIEHLVATYLRNDPRWKDSIIYWGPMGCLTGCYLVMKGRPAPQDIAPMIQSAYEFCAAFEGEVPGAAPKECGNYLLHDLPMARYEAARYVKRLRENPCYVYPQAQ